MQALLLVAAVLLLSSCGGDTAKPDQTIRALMLNEVQPTADIYWKSVQYISDEQGSREIVPTTDADWERTRASAARLGELGTLLATPAYSQGRGKDWVEFSNSLVEVAKLAEQAAVDRDVEQVFEVGGTAYYVCRSCHQAYPPAEDQSGEAGAEA